jgi:hypothetical protein
LSELLVGVNVIEVTGSRFTAVRNGIYDKEVG